MAGILVEDGLYIQDRGAVHCFEVPDAKPKPVNADDLGFVKPNRVWAMRTPRGEHAFLGSRRVAPRMDAQHVTIGEMKPGEDEDVVSDRQVPRGLADVLVEHEPRLRRALVGLSRRVAWIDQGRFYVTD